MSLEKNQLETIDVNQLKKDIQSEVTKRVTGWFILAAVSFFTLAAIGAWTLLRPLVSEQLDIVPRTELVQTLEQYLKKSEKDSLGFLDADDLPQQSDFRIVQLKTVTLESGRTPKTFGGALGVSASEGFCALSLITGRYDAYAERVGVYVKNGQWVYDFQHGAAKIGAHIECFGVQS